MSWSPVWISITVVVNPPTDFFSSLSADIWPVDVGQNELDTRKLAYLVGTRAHAGNVSSMAGQGLWRAMMVVVTIRARMATSRSRERHGTRQRA
jgi:hypothetical protein